LVGVAISTVTEESFFTFLASLYLHFALVDTINNSAQSIAKNYGFKQGHCRITDCPIPDRQPLQLSLNFFYALLDAVWVVLVCAKDRGRDSCPCL
jgi:hypothetical protein